MEVLQRRHGIEAVRVEEPLIPDPAEAGDDQGSLCSGGESGPDRSVTHSAFDEAGEVASHLPVELGDAGAEQFVRSERFEHEGVEDAQTARVERCLPANGVEHCRHPGQAILTLGIWDDIAMVPRTDDSVDERLDKAVLGAEASCDEASAISSALTDGGERQ